MSELTRLKDEATRLLTVYEEYKDCNDEHKRRKVHLDLDRFLMEHRHIAAVLMTQGLQDAFDQLVVETNFAESKKLPWYKRVIGGVRNGSGKNQKFRKSGHIEQQGL